MHSWEDFAFGGRKPIEGIALNPNKQFRDSRATLGDKNVVHNEFRVRVLIVIVILCCTAVVVRSDDISGAPAGARSLGPLPFQLILAREHLLGDWYGTRTWLEERGVTPTLTFVTDSLGNPSGGKEQGFTTANNVGLDLNFDLEKLCGLQGGSFLLSMSYRFGGSLSANYIHNVFTVQQVFGGETFNL